MIVGIAYFHVTIYFQINVRQQTCVPMAGFYQRFFAAWHLVAFSLVPPILMLLFGICTIKHLHHSLQRVSDIEYQSQNRTRRRRKSIDRQMIRMMLIQCVGFILTGSLPSVNFLYTSLRASQNLDALQLAKDNLMYNITGFVSLTVPCIGFYLFVLSSKLFRKELIKLLRSHSITLWFSITNWHWRFIVQICTNTLMRKNIPF